MRPWQRWLALGLGVGASLCATGSVLAQGASVPVVRDVLLDVAGRLDEKLGTWVQGGDLTDPEGHQFVTDLANFIGSLVSYIAEALDDLLVQLNFA
jgi:hypothetical protein